jgi:hypothetical protein
MVATRTNHDARRQWALTFSVQVLTTPQQQNGGERRKQWLQYFFSLTSTWNRSARRQLWLSALGDEARERCMAPGFIASRVDAQPQQPDHAVSGNLGCFVTVCRSLSTWLKKPTMNSQAAHKRAWHRVSGSTCHQLQMPVRRAQVRVEYVNTGS